MNTHGIICNFGRYKETPYTQVPVLYLKWMVRCNHRYQEIAATELKCRGTVTPDIDISGHAIDSASLHYWKIWQESHQKGKGLHAWLVRVTKEAIEQGEQDNKGR